MDNLQIDSACLSNEVNGQEGQKVVTNQVPNCSSSDREAKKKQKSTTVNSVGKRITRSSSATSGTKGPVYVWNMVREGFEKDSKEFHPNDGIHFYGVQHRGGEFGNRHY